MRPEPGSLVDEDLAERHTDLLFLLFEHQSTLGASMPLRLLRYMVRIWTRHLETQPGQPLPLIIPAQLAQVLDRTPEVFGHVQSARSGVGQRGSPVKGEEMFGRQPTFSTQTPEQRSAMKRLQRRFLVD